MRDETHLCPVASGFRARPRASCSKRSRRSSPLRVKVPRRFPCPCFSLGVRVPGARWGSARPRKLTSIRGSSSSVHQFSRGFVTSTKSSADGGQGATEPRDARSDDDRGRQLSRRGRAHREQRGWSRAGVGRAHGHAAQGVQVRRASPVFTRAEPPTTATMGVRRGGAGPDGIGPD